jgi:hypothetical protein
LDLPNWKDIPNPANFRELGHLVEPSQFSSTSDHAIAIRIPWRTEAARGNGGNTTRNRGRDRISNQTTVTRLTVPAVSKPPEILKMDSQHQQ